MVKESHSLDATLCSYVNNHLIICHYTNWHIIPKKCQVFRRHDWRTTYRICFINIDLCSKGKGARQRPALQPFRQNNRGVIIKENTLNYYLGSWFLVSIIHPLKSIIHHCSLCYFSFWVAHARAWVERERELNAFIFWNTTSLQGKVRLCTHYPLQTSLVDYPGYYVVVVVVEDFDRTLTCILPAGKMNQWELHTSRVKTTILHAIWFWKLTCTLFLIFRVKNFT